MIDNLSKEEIGQIFPIEIETYNSEWKELYEKEKELILNILTNKTVLLIEHIGSTSVPNLSSKPIIDILVVVSELTLELKKKLLLLLKSIGYENMSNAETDIKMSFGKGYSLTETKKQKFHLHIRLYNSYLWNDDIYFRNALLQNISIKNEYEQLKISLSQQYKYDREAYTEAKTEFIKKIIEIAKR